MRATTRLDANALTRDRCWDATRFGMIDTHALHSPTTKTMTTPRWPYPRVLAHRGGGTLAPENTMAALHAAVRYAFKGVEFDVMLASDSIPVLMHDPLFGRTIAGSGAVANTPSTTLMQTDAGAWFSHAFVGETVPTLADAVVYCRANDLWMNIEIKPSSDEAAYETGRVVGTLVRAAFVDVLNRLSPPLGELNAALPEFSSFSIDALAGVRETCPEIPRGLLVTTVSDDWFEHMNRVDARALHARARDVDQRVVQDAHARGLPLMVYTVNELEHAKTLFEWGVDALCTDRLDLVIPGL